MGGSISESYNLLADPLDLGGVRAGEAVDKQTEASAEATRQQMLASDKNLLFQQSLFDQQKELQRPWQEAGTQALAKIQDNPAFSFSASDFTASPAYQWNVQQGVNALDMSASSRGKLLSGAQDKAITNYGQQQAKNEYQNQYNNALQTYNTNLNTQKSLAGIGQESTNNIQNASNTYGQNVMAQNSNSADAISQNALYGANANASATAAQTNKNTAIVGTVASFFSDERLKENITFKEVKNGHNIYTWNWIDGTNDQPTEGVIAQEVQKYFPRAVIEDDSGYLKVNYSLLGL